MLNLIFWGTDQCIKNVDLNEQSSNCIIPQTPPPFFLKTLFEYENITEKTTRNRKSLKQKAIKDIRYNAGFLGGKYETDRFQVSPDMKNEEDFLSQF